MLFRTRASTVKRIMLVDDDPTEVFFFEEALEYNGANLDIIF